MFANVIAALLIYNACAVQWPSFPLFYYNNNYYYYADDDDDDDDDEDDNVRNDYDGS